MIVPSLLAKSRSRIVARIARSSQSRRRTAWSSGPGLTRQGREAGRQLGHDAAALLRGQSDPAADLGGRAPAADAKARACVEDADLVAGSLDGAVDLGHAAARCCCG